MPNRVLTVVGARPQFVKAAVVSRGLRDRAEAPYEDLLVHTGQHYDHGMSQVFFDELEIPEPEVNLNIPGGSHGAATGAMLSALEDVTLHYEPAAVVVYGDTNTTLAAALAAAKLHVPVAHVEAGLRSFNRRMPEEINRVVTDHVSSLLLCPSSVGAANLAKEGITEGVEVVGDTMLDAVHHYVCRAPASPADETYLVATLHRAENTEEPARLRAILAGLAASDVPIILPLHPRTVKTLRREGLELPPSVRPMDPVPYLTMLSLVRGSVGVLTDSGGLQKEAFFLSKPCVTLRDETEWTELVELGVNRVVGANTERIADALVWLRFVEMPAENPYGDGRAADRIIDAVSALAG